MRFPNPNNVHNRSTLFDGPQGLKRDYDGLYKALEYQTSERIHELSQQDTHLIDELERCKQQNNEFQTTFDKALRDNKALYDTCKHLETYVIRSSTPMFNDNH